MIIPVAVHVKPLSEKAALALKDSVSSHQSKIPDLKNDTRSPNNDASHPAHTLFRTNYRPDDNQTDRLHALLDEKLAEIADHDHSLSSLQVKIGKLLKKVEVINIERLANIDTVNFYKFILSPLRLLPPEILGQIFLYAVESYAPTPRDSPLAFTHVCSAWRHAALQCSNLWNELDLSPGNFRNSLGPERFSAFFDSWFSRAHPVQPLRLSLNFDETAPHLEAEFTNQLCRSVASVSSRLSELSIVFSAGAHNILESFLSNESGDLAALEVLSVADFSGTWWSEVFPPVKVFVNAPRLCEVYLDVRANTLVNSSRFSLPWSQLNILDIWGTISLGDFVEVIFQCPQLRVGYFMQVNAGSHLNHANGELVLPSTPITFPALVDFKIRFVEVDAGPAFEVMEFLEMPVIERFTMACHPYFQIPFSFVRPVLPDVALQQSLRSLSLCDVDVEDNLDPLLACIAGCHLLEELTLCICGTPSTAILQHLLLLAKSQSSHLDHPKPLSHLRVFMFAFVLLSSGNDDFMAIGLLFSQVLVSLIKDSTRHYPLESAGLYVCDYYRPSFDQEQLKPLTASIEAHVRDAEACIRDAETRRHTGGSTTGGIDLDVKVLTSFSDLLPAFDNRLEYAPFP
ncbi:hypothetical protein DXG03_000660 [Asterophora parasitica]|uniref:F-box domain-containing protein n=1 Tax=Asterophora parasitica TaxID=117018 RepID=A0A9P7G699_9AGAR|nr:hypothetical protein DXG03_000660 [Asterophora parasitica]